MKDVAVDHILVLKCMEASNENTAFIAERIVMFIVEGNWLSYKGEAQHILSE